MNRVYLIFDGINTNSVGMEIGVWKGEFSKEIINILKPQLLYLVDPWEFMGHYSDRLYGGFDAKSQEDMDAIYDNVVNQFKHNNNVKILKIKSDDILNYVPENSLDWVYIDGNHSYEFVLSDLKNSFKLVKKDGYILGDDYGQEVEMAVKDFVSEYKSNIEYLTSKIAQFKIKLKKDSSYE